MAAGCDCTGVLNNLRHHYRRTVSHNPADHCPQRNSSCNCRWPSCTAVNQWRTSQVGAFPGDDAAVVAVVANCTCWKYRSVSTCFADWKVSIFGRNSGWHKLCFVLQPSHRHPRSDHYTVHRVLCPPGSPSSGCPLSIVCWRSLAFSGRSICPVVSRRPA